MKKSLRILVSIGMLAVLIAGYAVLCNREMASTKPGDGVKTITEFHNVMDSARTYQYMTFRKDNVTYFEARKLMPSWTLPSGPSCYVFDPAGKLVDWIPDNGESREWDTKWGQTGRSETSFEEILEEVSNDA